MCFLPRNSKAHPMLQVLFSFQRFRQLCKIIKKNYAGLPNVFCGNICRRRISTLQMHSFSSVRNRFQTFDSAR